jgi:hypothetical protein
MSQGKGMNKQRPGLFAETAATSTAPIPSPFKESGGEYLQDWG